MGYVKLKKDKLESTGGKKSEKEGKRKKKREGRKKEQKKINPWGRRLSFFFNWAPLIHMERNNKGQRSIGKGIYL